MSSFTKTKTYVSQIHFPEKLSNILGEHSKPIAFLDPNHIDVETHTKILHFRSATHNTYGACILDLTLYLPRAVISMIMKSIGNFENDSFLIERNISEQVQDTTVIDTTRVKIDTIMKDKALMIKGTYRNFLVTQCKTLEVWFERRDTNVVSSEEFNIQPASEN